MGKNVFRARRVGKQRDNLDIVYEDDDVLVVNKPAGLITSSTPREKRATLLKMIEEHLGGGRHGLKTRATGRRPPPRAGVIHRLDADAEGLLVFSKNNSAYHGLKALFFRHSVERIYHTVVHGTPQPPAGRI